MKKIIFPKIGVKICGLNSQEGVMAVCEGGAAFAGFVFYPASPRYVSDMALVNEWAGMCRESGVITVGLFVNAALEEIMDIVAKTGLDAVQLHGQEDNIFCQTLRSQIDCLIFKAFSVRSSDALMRAVEFSSFVDGIFLDAPPPQTDTSLPGGNGHCFDWSLLKTNHWDKDLQCPWFLAGGLHKENLQLACQQTNARYLDVSSGVEVQPGQKSVQKIKEFIAVVHDLLK